MRKRTQKPRDCADIVSEAIVDKDVQGAALHMMTCSECMELIAPRATAAAEEVVALLEANIGEPAPQHVQESTLVISGAMIALSLAHALASAQEGMEAAMDGAMGWNTPMGEA